MDAVTFGYFLAGSHLVGVAIGACVAFVDRMRDSRENAEFMAGLVDLPSGHVYTVDVGSLQPEQALEFVDRTREIVDQNADTPIRMVPVARYHDLFDSPQNIEELPGFLMNSKRKDNS
jgi:hypothetical protein